jgi:hypothetical protein
MQRLFIAIQLSKISGSIYIYILQSCRYIVSVLEYKEMSSIIDLMISNVI